MIDAEWEELRARLCTQFSEDVVQTVLLKLHEFLLDGSVIESEPIYWCRTAAYRVKLNQIRDDKNEADALPMVKTRFASSVSPEQEVIFLEQEIYDRLSQPINQRTGKPASHGTLAKRRQRLAKRRLAA